MSAVMVVQELGTSAGGKPKCKINNVWYFLPTDKDTGYGNSPSIGQTIEFEVGSFSMGNPPKSFATIERWRPVSQSTTQQLPPSQGQRPQSGQPALNQPAPSSQGTPAELWHAFVGQGLISNVLAESIKAGLIKEPGQLLTWVNALKSALEGKPTTSPSLVYDDTIKNKDW